MAGFLNYYEVPVYVYERKHFPPVIYPVGVYCVYDEKQAQDEAYGWGERNYPNATIETGTPKLIAFHKVSSEIH